MSLPPVAADWNQVATANEFVTHPPGLMLGHACPMLDEADGDGHRSTFQRGEELL
jgi:hypothetical protein